MNCLGQTTTTTKQNTFFKSNHQTRTLKSTTGCQVPQPQLHQHPGTLVAPSCGITKWDHNTIHHTIWCNWRGGYDYSSNLQHPSRKFPLSFGKLGKMDRVPRDSHCSHGCRSRTRKPATAHPHRGGWYVFAKQSPSCKSSLLFLLCQILTTSSLSTNPSSSLPSHPASNTSVTTWYLNLIADYAFFHPNKLWLAFSSTLLGFFSPLCCTISTHGMVFSTAGLPLPVPTVIFWHFEIVSADFLNGRIFI